jgi:D-alanyl-D-alanine carboxypeptidase/D-alanyl-D-alanine-endopeptidase (penicillin-binding protein 4)
MNCLRVTRVVWLVAIAAILAGNAPASRLESRVKRLIAQSPAGRSGFVGILVVDEKGRKLLAINADRSFIPASNTKLFSTALALQKLEVGKRFETRVELRESERGNDLVLIGTGDANLSGRVLPYRYNSPPGAPLSAIDDLAAQIVARGIREVHDVFGDDTAFLYEPFAPGWAAEDVLYSDGSPVSALVVNDDTITMQVTAGPKDGAPVQVTLNPPLDEFQVENHALTGTVDDIHTDRVSGTALWRIWGTISAAAHPYTDNWAVSDPAQFAAAALKYSLEQHGVHVSGAARAIHRLPGVPFVPGMPGEVVAKRESLPLVEDLIVTDKVSQNLHADLLLFDVGGSREQGLKGLADFLNGVGIPANQYRFYDGSGLSRMNLVTPQAVVTLLRFMANSEHREYWMTFLPISGVDGSLATRLTGSKVKGRIHAKTGSLNHVSALSGYADTRKGKRLTFSIFINNSLADTGALRDLIDKICSVLVE